MPKPAKSSSQNKAHKDKERVKNTRVQAKARLRKIKNVSKTRMRYMFVPTANKNERKDSADQRATNET